MNDHLTPRSDEEVQSAAFSSKWQENSLSGALRANNIWPATAMRQVGRPADLYASLNGAVFFLRNEKC